MAKAPTAPLSSPIIFAQRLTSRTALCCGPMKQPLIGDEAMTINGIAAKKPYLATFVNLTDGTHTALSLIRVPEGKTIDAVSEVAFTRPGRVVRWKNSSASKLSIDFETLLGKTSESDRAKILLLLIRCYSLAPELAGDVGFENLCRLSRLALTGTESRVVQACWLRPNLLYMEALLPEHGYEEARLLHTGEDGMVAAVTKLASHLYHPAEKGYRRYSLFAAFPRADMAERAAKGKMTLLVKDRAIPVAMPARRETGVAGLLTHLKAMPEELRLALRDFIVREMIDTTAKADIPAASEVVRLLQQHLLPETAALRDPEAPFGIMVDTALSLGNDALFLSGWVHDPTERLESITIYSDLGYALNLTSLPHRHARLDVEEMYDGGPFPSASVKSGFVQLIELPEPLRAKLKDWPASFGIRLRVVVKGGLTYHIAPKTVAFDPVAARERFLEIAAGDQAPGSPSRGMLSRAALFLQQACIREAAIGSQAQFGKAPVKPQVSLIIPLYRELDFVATQIACFAHDPFMRETEILYVLDSPEQEEEVRAQLASLAELYDFPLRLVVMQKNAGYAAATNAGASLAKAPYLLLFNSDVVPIRAGWLAPMLARYQADPSIGALGPKLLLEDDGIQHAGMYFAANNAEGFYENLHYFKGYPASHPPAQMSRFVPAVTGACMLVSAARLREVGGLSEDYLIGDFEDSDFCLRLAARGWPSYYFAGSELYHFERQSMGAQSLRQQARYRLNGRLQHQRFGRVIQQGYASDAPRRTA